MKNFKLAVLFMLAMPSAVMLMDDNIKNNLQLQALQLRKMLIECNDTYLSSTTPMSEQSLTVHWALSYLAYFNFRLKEGSYTYTSEVLLAESKKLADVIVVLEKLQESEINDVQACLLIKQLIKTNDAYIHNTPMYQQNLNLEWWISYFVPYRIVQGTHCYNAEILLNESKNLSDIIAYMVYSKNNKKAAQQD
jgi:hypothetical protein